MVRPPGLEPGSEMPALRSGAEVPWVSHVVNYDEVGPGRKNAILDYREPLSLAHRHRGRVSLRFTENEECRRGCYRSETMPLSASLDA